MKVIVTDDEGEILEVFFIEVLPGTEAMVCTQIRDLVSEKYETQDVEI